MSDERRHVTLSKAHRATAVGRQLIELLSELSSDGNVSREEMERLRSWLEVERGVDFPALPFLYETIDQISSDGEVTEEELDRLALAIERVLPKEVRLAAMAKRKEAREARRVAERENRRQTMIASRAEKRALREAERARRGILYRADFAIRGAFRFEERREACERLRLWETPEGQVVPIVLANIRQGDTDLSAPAGLPRPDAKRSEASRGDTPQTRKGCGAALVVTVLVALALATMGACVVGIDRL